MYYDGTKLLSMTDINGNKPEILAKFADVKHLKLEEYTELGTGDDYKYIVKSMDNHLWGLIKIKNSGKIEQVLPYEYESMTYDIDTGYYILCKNKKQMLVKKHLF